jgi:hypothetical protein
VRLDIDEEAQGILLSPSFKCCILYSSMNGIRMALLLSLLYMFLLPLPAFVLFSFLIWHAAEDTQHLNVLLSALEERAANEPLVRS